MAQVVDRRARYWRSTELPDNHCWANGDLIYFNDWPELKEIYEAGGFEGMLMGWDADVETQKANRASGGPMPLSLRDCILLP